jgi:polysaccharide biosynthesis/export protein
MLNKSLNEILSKSLLRPISSAAIAPALIAIATLQAPASAQTPSASSSPAASPTLAQTAPFPLPALAATTLSSQSGAYVLGPGDQLDIKVYGFEEYTGTQVVLPDGTITMPLLGDVMAMGRTAGQLTQELTARLQKLVKNPVVTIGVGRLRPLRVNVAGEVLRPGPVQLQSLAPVNAVGSTNRVLMPTLSEAIAQAGGITPRADIRKVVVKRATLTGPTTLTIDLWEALKSENAPGDMLLMDGDALFIPTATAANPIDRRLLARATFSPKTVRVRVVGEVKKPGEVEVTPQSSLSSAVAIAGGPTDKARLRRVVFVRMHENGTVERKQLDLRNLVDDYQVQDGDVVMVPKDGGRDLLDIGSQLLGPLGLVLNIFK